MWAKATTTYHVAKNQFFSKSALGNISVRVVLHLHTCLLRKTEEKWPVIDRQPEIKRNEKKENLPQAGVWERRGGMAVPISYDPNDLKLGRQSPYINWMQSPRGEKKHMISPLDPRPTIHPFPFPICNQHL